MSTVTAVGLLLDLVGAILIAVPDASFLANQFEVGKLTEARKRMESGGVEKGDPGFEELNEAIQELDPVADHGSSTLSDDYNEIVVNTKNGYGSMDADFQWGSKYVEARIGENPTWEDMDYYEVQDVYDIIQTEVKPQSAKFRLYGFSLLSFGFLIQIFAALNFPWALSIAAILMVIISLPLLYFINIQLKTF